MSESEELLLKEKAEEFNRTVSTLNFRLMRATKTIKNCRETCKNTLQIIGELNGNSKEHQ